MVGYPLLAIAELENAEGADYQWYKEESEGVWVPLASDGMSSRLYTPTEQDVGCKLKITCSPYRESDSLR